MDIYKYIRSKDIREYNKKIGHKFNALESCFLVWRNSEIPLSEKHEAWRQICLEMPDMEIKQRNNVDYAPSLHELIEDFVATDKLLKTNFYKEGDKAVYYYRFYCEGDSGWCEDFSAPYSDLKLLEKRLKEDFDLPIIMIEYKKQYLDCPNKSIILSTKKDGTVVDICAEGFDDKHLSDMLNFDRAKQKDHFF